MEKILTWQYLVVSDDKEKYPSLVLNTSYHENGDFDECYLAIASPNHLEAIAKANDAGGAFSPVSGHLSAIPIRITPREAFVMINQYPAMIDLERYEQLGVPFSEKGASE